MKPLMGSGGPAQKLERLTPGFGWTKHGGRFRCDITSPFIPALQAYMAELGIPTLAEHSATRNGDYLWLDPKHRDSLKREVPNISAQDFKALIRDTTKKNFREARLQTADESPTREDSLDDAELPEHIPEPVTPDVTNTASPATYVAEHPTATRSMVDLVLAPIPTEPEAIAAALRKPTGKPWKIQEDGGRPNHGMLVTQDMRLKDAEFLKRGLLNKGFRDEDVTIGDYNRTHYLAISPTVAQEWLQKRQDRQKV